MNSTAHLNDLSLRLLGRAYDDLDIEESRVLEAIAARAPSSRDAADLGDAQASRGDRLAAGVDYEINLRAELEIMRLHEKLDQMRFHELREKVDELCDRLDRKE